jgi:RNA polymerase sigma-B factor
MAAPALAFTERGQLSRAIAEYSRTGDHRLRNQIIAAHQGLAYSLSGRFRRQGEDIDDLNQVALIGLMKAIDRFDPDRGAELTTFATATILGELKRYLRDRGWSVRLPRRIHDLHLRSQLAIDELTQELGRSPRMLEVSERVGEAMEDVLEALEAGGLRHSTSLESSIVPGEDAPFGYRLGSMDEDLAGVDRRIDLLPLLRRLPEREQLILRLRFMVGCSQTEIASKVGVSQMHVSRLLSRSLAQLHLWASDAGERRA